MVVSLRFASLALLAIAVVLFSAPAQAEEGSVVTLMGNPDSDRSPEGVFDIVDTNDDGKIDRAELTNRKMAVFSLHDRNEDSALSHQELDVVNDAMFAAMDQNGDGAVSGFEFNQSDLTKFETMDADGDNAISLEEFRSFRLDINR